MKKFLRDTWSFMRNDWPFLLLVVAICVIPLVVAWNLPPEPVCLAGHNEPAKCRRTHHHGIGKYEFNTYSEYDCVKFVCDHWQAEAPE